MSVVAIGSSVVAASVTSGTSVVAVGSSVIAIGISVVAIGISVVASGSSVALSLALFPAIGVSAVASPQPVNTVAAPSARRASVARRMGRLVVRTMTPPVATLAECNGDRAARVRSEGGGGLAFKKLE
eukprot:CAMPEP_0198535578 /NCGR_PEP_ID=MMETSP1462-20131121/39786_1 /TAXON_ID=1333877 /ORGANISM="Brandtodinium nutriculum, Strain RCC3387" /LENGTH=127 /DNA_ID=CAMNT_0044265517 /DNA_START=29 /DNA_END=410 /DNA_ORIENTATION=-